MGLILNYLLGVRVMKKRVKFIILRSCTAISVVGFNALNSSQALQRHTTQQSILPINNILVADRDFNMGLHITTDYWGGNWSCRSDSTGLYSSLNIEGYGVGSNISAYYPKAHGDQPAREVYSIENISRNDASGSYEYRDANPNIGPTGQRGVWIGNWRINVQGKGTNPVMSLYREDLASGWRGTYRCTRTRRW